MPGITKKESVLRRAAKDVAEIYGKDKAVEVRKQVDKVAKFVGGLSDIGYSALMDLSSTNAFVVIAKAAKVEREAAKAASKAAKAQPVGAAAA